MQRWFGMTTRDTLLIISFSVALLLIIVNAYLVEETRSSQFRYNTFSNRSADVIRTLEHVTTRLALAEGAVRGYVLTGDASFESDYNSKLQETWTLLSSIQQYRLVAAEESLLITTTRSIDERAELLRRAIFLRKRSFTEAQDLLHSGEPVRVMNEFLSNVDSLSILLNARLDAEAEAEDEQVVLLLFLSRGGSLLAIAIIIIALVSTSRYLNERNYGEHLLRLSEERFRLAVENSPVVQFVAEPGGTITMIEGTGLHAFGTDPDALMGRPISDLLGTQDVIGDAFARALHGESTIREVEVGTSSVEVFLAPYRKESGAIAGVTGIWRDISERKRAEKALEDVRVELERSNNDLEQFAYVASHDLQAPVHAMRQYIRLLEEGHRSVMSPAGVEYLDRMKTGLEHMLSLIRDLLEYSKVGSTQPALGWVDLSALAEDAVRELEPEVKKKRGQIEIGRLPVVRGNEGQLRQVFRNLIGNGLKFTTRRPPVIRIHSEERDNAWVISITDNGVGIREEDQERIFKIFYRTQSSEHVHGNGLGLAITKRIIEKHGGKITVASRPGEGSTFSILLQESSL